MHWCHAEACRGPEVDELHTFQLAVPRKDTTNVRSFQPISTFVSSAFSQISSYCGIHGISVLHR